MIKIQFLVHLSGAKRVMKERESEGGDRRGGTKKSRGDRVIEGKEVRGDYPIKYYFPQGVKYLLSSKGVRTVRDS